MEIRDIVNRDIVNLTNCEQEPIHIPGSIQPHGFLLGLKQDTLIIEYCSANCTEYTGLTHKQLLGKGFDAVFGDFAFENLKNYISKNLILSSDLLELNLGEHFLVCSIHLQNGFYIIEAEPNTTKEKNNREIYDQTSQFLSYMQGTHTLKELCNLVAKGTRKITGYDRVMIYRFDKDYNGEVFAESCREDLESFLGLHYPHTDIPPQARELYMQNLLRLIVDINYEPVPIYTIDTENKTLDLSLSILRSTSPIHVQYLQNMGVGATLTISLIHQKKLWGLIACHHYSEKNISSSVRLAAQLQGHFITSQIDLRQSNEEYEVARKTSLALEKINVKTININSNTFASLIEQSEILKLCNATGVSILVNNRIYKNGLAPSDEEITHLANWCATYSNNTNFYTDKLLDSFPEYKSLCERISGIIYHSLNNNNTNCIIWYRPETKSQVNWAGDPSKSIIKDKKGLSPRNSFKLWKEIIKCKSKPWKQPELDTAASYAHSLQRQINLLILSQEEQKYRKLSELLKETNSELENINWISTHDLQEPLRKIQLISSRLLSKEEKISNNVQEAIKRMSNSANRMQTLLIDILKYTKLSHINANYEKVDINKVLQDVIADFIEIINEKNIIINIHPLPIIEGIPFLLKQLFSNLISNSIKYSIEEKQTIIEITASEIPENFAESNDKSALYNIIYIKDNGIGFDPQYSESIFSIFKRLHAVGEYKGSGVGLALCKKIMQNHKGYITASGEVNQGATIKIYFPIN